MIDKKTVTAIILIAGNSTRFGKNRNKNFEIINGKPVFAYSLEAFNNNSYIDNIIIAIKESERKEVETYINTYSLTKNLDIIVGGDTRKQSVYNCIKKSNSDMTEENQLELERLKESINQYKNMDKISEKKKDEEKEDYINSFNNNIKNGELNKEVGEKAKSIQGLNNKIEESPNENDEAEYEEIEEEEEIEVTEEIEVDEDQAKNMEKE